MPYSGNPLSNPLDRVRLIVGDIWDDMEMLSDEDYQYFLLKYKGNENRAGMDAARAILFKIARNARQRTGDIEVYGGEWFKNYRDALKLILTNPDISISLAVPYAGGISRSDMESNDNSDDNVRQEFFIGFRANKPLYQPQRETVF